VPRVKFFATLARAAGTREAGVQAGSVKELLEKLSRDYEGKLDRYLKTSTVLVNGKNVEYLKGEKTKLKLDDVVSIYPPLGGG
jgi:molybdopterin synthase sulfur carrier subunit